MGRDGSECGTGLLGMILTSNKKPPDGTAFVLQAHADMFHLGNVTYLLDVTPSNWLPYPLSPTPIPQDFVAKQHSTNLYKYILHTLWNTHVTPDVSSGLILAYNQLVCSFWNLCTPRWLQPYNTPKVAHIHSRKNPFSYACVGKQLLLITALICL